MSMSSAGRAENSNGCVTRPKGREIGLSGFAAQIQLYSLTGSYVMATAEHREPCESRGSCTVLGARGGEIPPRDSTFTSFERPVGCRFSPQQRKPAWPRETDAQCQQWKSAHSITSSASNCIELGTSMPSALAVLRLMTRSNLVGCSTGNSPGLAPRKILST